MTKQELITEVGSNFLKAKNKTARDAAATVALNGIDTSKPFVYAVVDSSTVVCLQPGGNKSMGELQEILEGARLLNSSLWYYYHPKKRSVPHHIPDRGAINRRVYKETEEQEMKQFIIVPNKVTSTFFNLPCIEGACKDNDDVVRYLISPRYTTNGDYMMAYPGDTLIEEDTGKWRTERKQKIKQQ